MICSLWPVPNGTIKSVEVPPETRSYNLPRSDSVFFTFDQRPEYGGSNYDIYHVMPNRHGGHTLVLEGYNHEFINRELAILIEEVSEATQKLNALTDRYTRLKKLSS